MALPKQGSTVLDLIDSERRIKGAPLVMVGHSLGGLVIKMALANALTQGVSRYRHVADLIKGVVFVATPNLGSDLASLATALIGMRANAQVDDLRSGNAWLAPLNNQFRALHQQLGFSVRIFSESRGVTTKRRWGFFRGPTVRVVSDPSSDPGVPGETPISLPEDHFSICKPADRNAQIHKSLLAFLADVQTKVDGLRPVGPIVELAATVGGQKGPSEEATDASASPPQPVQLAFGRFGFDDPAAPVLATVCIVTDDAARLSAEIDACKARVRHDPLLSEPARLRADTFELSGLVDDPAFGARVLDWLSVISFSAYLYYAPKASLADVTEVEQRRRFLVQPLVHRLSKKSEVIVSVRADGEDIAAAFDAAMRSVRHSQGRQVPQSALVGPSASGSRALVELAQWVAKASAMHLGAPGDERATTAFNHLRTRLRFAKNVATDETHTRDRNRLP